MRPRLVDQTCTDCNQAICGAVMFTAKQGYFLCPHCGGVQYAYDTDSLTGKQAESFDELEPADSDELY